MYKVKKVNVMSLAYMMAMIHLIFGIIQGAILLIAKNFPQLTFLQSADLASLTLQQILIYSIGAYAIGGLILGIIIGLAYNFIASYTGGVSISLKKDN